MLFNRYCVCILAFGVFLGWGYNIRKKLERLYRLGLGYLAWTLIMSITLRTSALQTSDTLGYLRLCQRFTICSGLSEWPCPVCDNGIFQKRCDCDNVGWTNGSVQQGMLWRFGLLQCKRTNCIDHPGRSRDAFTIKRELISNERCPQFAGSTSYRRLAW